MPKLVANRYGKGRVRVLKVLRDGATHRVKDLNVTAMLEGDLDKPRRPIRHDPERFERDRAHHLDEGLKGLVAGLKRANAPD